MPEALSRIGQLFANTAAWVAAQQEQKQSTAGKKKEGDAASASRGGFQATAGIVNYYNAKSVMGPHRDDLEEATTQPVVSFSVGRPAVFLLGGSTLESEPVVPIVVRPGDVMILGGESRLNYHSMARLLPKQLPEEARTMRRCEEELDPHHHQVRLEQIFGNNGSAPPPTVNEVDRTALAMYLSQHRININLRQVYYSNNN